MRPAILAMLIVACSSDAPPTIREVCEASARTACAWLEGCGETVEPDCELTRADACCKDGEFDNFCSATEQRPEQLHQCEYALGDCGDAIPMECTNVIRWD